MKDYRYGPYDKLIEQKVAKMSIRDEYKPFIVDIMRRRAFQYDLPENQVNLELDRLQTNLKKITSERSSTSAVGFYEYSKLRINLSRFAAFANSKRYTYSTLAHEVFHAIAKFENRDLMGGRNQVTGWSTRGLLEPIVEAASYALVYPTKSDNPYYNKNVSAYEATVFAPEMICATFGINKQDLMKYAIQGRAVLDRFLAQKTGFTERHIGQFMDEFETNMDAIHEIVNNGKNAKNMTRSAKAEIMEKTMDTLANKCFDMMERIHGSKDEKEYTPEYFEDRKFNYNKMMVAIEEGCKDLKSSKSYFSISKAMKNINENARGFNNAILQSEYLVNYKKKYEVPYSLRQFERWAKYGNLKRTNRDLVLEKAIQRMEELSGVEVPEVEEATKRFEVSKEAIARNNPPEEKLEEWDNTFIKTHNIKRAIAKAHRKDRIDRFKELLGIKPKMLNPGQREDEKEYTIEDLNRDSKSPIEELVLSPEEKQRIEKERLEQLSKMNKDENNRDTKTTQEERF